MILAQPDTIPQMYMRHKPHDLRMKVREEIPSLRST
jgi:hypothetical protein